MPSHFSCVKIVSLDQCVESRVVLEPEWLNVTDIIVALTTWPRYRRTVTMKWCQTYVIVTMQHPGCWERIWEGFFQFIEFASYFHFNKADIPYLLSFIWSKKNLLFTFYFYHFLVLGFNVSERLFMSEEILNSEWNRVQLQNLLWSPPTNTTKVTPMPNIPAF